MSEKTLYQKVYDLYKTSADSNQYQTWRRERDEAWAFYDGQQWTEKQMKAIASVGQAPIVVNKLAPKVDALCGSEIQNRTQISFIPRNFDQDTYLRANVLTNLATAIQENNSMGRVKANQFKSSVIGGLGWVKTYDEEGIVKIEHIRDREMLWDTTDTTLDMTEQRYCARLFWMDVGEAIKKFPAHAKELKAIKETYTSEASVMGEEKPTHFYDKKTNKVLIVQLQYKEVKPAYRFTDKKGNLRETFDKQRANKFKSEGEITEFYRDKVYDCYFTDGILLQHYPLSVQVEELEYQPLVWKRRDSDDVPVGLIASAKDLQVEYNKRRSKAIHSMSSRRVIADSDAIDDIDAFKREAAQPDGVLLKRAGTDIRFEDNMAFTDSQLNLMNQTSIELQEAMGISDDMLGQETNAVSGLAIAHRKQASATKQSFIFDKIKDMNKKLGKVLLAHIQNLDELISIRFVGDDGKPLQNVIVGRRFGDEKDANANYVDISVDGYDVVVKETNEYIAPSEQVAEHLMQIMNSPQVTMMAGQAPELLKTLGIPNADIISKQLQGASQPPQEAGVPTEQQPSLPQ